MSNQHNYQADDFEEQINLAIAESLKLQQDESEQKATLEQSRQSKARRIEVEILLLEEERMAESEKYGYPLFGKDYFNLPQTAKMDKLAAEYANLWFTSKKATGIDTFVISIGSNNSAEQCHPTFARGKNNVAVLNIDPNFNDKEVKGSFNCFSTKAAFNFDKNTYPEFYKAIARAINSELYNNNKVVLMSSTWCYGYTDCLLIINQNINDLGKNFTYVQSYHDEQPVAIFKECFFTAMRMPGIREELNRTLIRKLWQNETNEEFLTTEKIAAIVQENNLDKYGKFFASLKDIQLEDLFPQKTVEKNEKPQSSSFFRERVGDRDELKR